MSICNRFGSLLAAIVLLGTTSTATAGISGVNVDAMVIAPPASVVSGALTDNDVSKVFSEGESIILGGTLTLDQTAPGFYTGSSPSVGATIGAGNEVRSYFVHYDPVDNSTSIKSSAGSITFETEILGIIYTLANVNGSDSLVGFAGTTYPTGIEPDRDLESKDGFTISADRRTVDFLLTVTTATDHFRVITRAPEPATYGMLGLFLAFAAAAKRRQGRVA